MKKKHKLLIRYGEISLKGKNQDKFIDSLVFNIKEKLKDFSEIEIKKIHGRIFIDFLPEDKTEVYNSLTKTFGIVSFSEVYETELNIDYISKSVIKEMINAVSEGCKTFKIESRRSNKGFHMKSPEISAYVGAQVLKNIDGLKVDVHNPDIRIDVEIRNKAYIFSKVIKSQGGMPYGSSGKGLVLLSGGIDSPVAAYMMAKRGLFLEAVHYHSYPFTGEKAREKVISLAEKLCEYIPGIKLHLVNISNIQQEIKNNCPSEEMTVHSRRFMMRIASKISRNRNIQALVTGESLAQVASQTIEGMTVIEDAADLPIFKPLIAFDKVDTIKISKDIDCFKTSILPYEDCCTVFLPPRVVTRPQLDKIKKSEEKLDINKLVDTAIDNMETLDIKKKTLSEISKLL